MGESLNCQICNKVATIHLTQIINNKIEKVHLCEECAQAKGVTDPEGDSLQDLFFKTKLVSEEFPFRKVIVCQECKHSSTDFQRRGRLGCAVCYEQLSSVIKPLLRNMHQDTIHQGKIPHHAIQRYSLHERLNNLEQNLHHAIENEWYEKAALFRDEISQLKEALNEKSKA